MKTTTNFFRRYIDIVNEMNDIATLGQVSKPEAKYQDMPVGGQRCADCKHFLMPNKCNVVQGTVSPNGWCEYYYNKTLEEKWGEETTVSPSERGKYKGKSLEELRKSYNALKASGPHRRGSPEFGRMRELAFAIRAKTGWGSVD